MSVSSHSIERPIHRLLRDEPFYAHFLLGARIVMDYPGCPTAGAAIINGSIVFVINSEFFFNLTLNEQVAVLKHEVMHVLLEHTSIRKVEKQYHQVANVAMDCAINQHISNIPKGAVVLETVEEMVKKKLNPFEPYEYYYDIIRKAMKEKEAEGKVENHGFMNGEEGEGGPGELGELGEPTDGPPMSDEQKRALVAQAAKRAMDSAAGNIPGYLAKVLELFGQANKISWKQMLRNVVASTPIPQQRNTRKKSHRRFELDQPGKKRKRQLKVAVCCDSSGSVSDEAYMAFMTEIMNISKNTAVTYVIQADCEVKDIKVIKGAAKKNTLTNRQGYGGTAYQPAIDAAKKKKVDLILYFGDMDAADTPVDPRIPFVWVRVGKSTPPGNFGKIIDLEVG